MISTIRKIYLDKKIQSFKLNYNTDITYHKKEVNRNHIVKKKNIAIEQLIHDGSSILDIGCNDGDLLAYLLKKKENIDVLGVDISGEAVRIANKRGVKAICLDITKEQIPEKWMFDYIIMADFIEHIPDPENFFLKLYNHFRKAIIVSFPNVGYITSRLRLFIGGRFPIQWGRHPGEHLRFWTVKDFNYWTHQLGYKVVSTIPIQGPYLKIIWPGLFSTKNLFVIAKNCNENSNARGNRT
jgi:methionine biosynthesis protein MetW